MEMTAQTTDMKAPAIYASLLIFKLNHRLFLNCLEAVTEEQSRQRISAHSNPFIWIATHTLWARYNTVNILGGSVENPFKGMFENFKPYDPNDVYPSLATIKELWEKVGPILNEALHNITGEQLAAPAVFKSPIGDDTTGGTIIFLAEHESYDIGQMGFLKKYLTKEAMKY